MLKIILVVKTVDSDVTWDEEYDCPSDNPNEWAKAIIDNFNDTLRPYEVMRELIEVKVVSEDNTKDHKWGKTNLFTIVRGSRIYDEMKCNNCGITGKRFGIRGDYVVRDSKYKAEKYEKCN